MKQSEHGIYIMVKSRKLNRDHMRRARGKSPELFRERPQTLQVVGRRKNMQKTANLIFILLLLSLAHCQRIDCVGGTRETKTKEYFGDKSATSPYADKTKLSVSSGCNSSGCDYTLLARVCLHNPTDKTRSADIHCDYYAGDWKANSNERNDVEVVEHSSKCVEIQQQITGISRSMDVGVTCITTWH